MPLLLVYWLNLHILVPVVNNVPYGLHCAIGIQCIATGEVGTNVVELPEFHYANLIVKV